MLLASCAGERIVTPMPGNCLTVTPTVLNLGEHAIIDPTVTGGCLLLPAAGSGGAEYLVAAVATAGTATPNGSLTSYFLNSIPAPIGTSRALLRRAASRPVSRVAEFDTRLRQYERTLSGNPDAGFPAAAARIRSGPIIAGVTQDTFTACTTFSTSASTPCSAFSTVVATAKYVGPKAAIFLDDTLPNGGVGGYTQSDIDAVGVLFDGGTPNMYAIDTAAFGLESDLDQNGKVIVLLTQAVNRVSQTTGACAVGQRVLGFFFGFDLTAKAGSNQGEIFYGLVPDPTNSACAVSKALALGYLPQTFIHEFQHMISFNRHVLIPCGGQVCQSFRSEETWLNEGLSHFAEELGGRELSNSQCPLAPTCLDQFATNNLDNAWGYLSDPERFFLIPPDNAPQALEERGAAWLFVRWLADQFAGDSILGTSLTRALDGAGPGGITLLGEANVTAATGTPFSTLIPQWQMANALEGVPSFLELTGRLRYKSWDLFAYYSAHPLGG
jgi:hypothetical protein